MKDIRPNDLEFMKSPAKWPQWPVLPLKKYEGGLLITALMMEVFGGGFAIMRNANLFAPDTWQNAEPCDPEELVKEGWVVD